MQCAPYGTCSTVTPMIVRVPTSSGTVSTTITHSGNELASTGVSVALLLAIVIALLIAGLVLIRKGRHA